MTTYRVRVAGEDAAVTVEREAGMLLVSVDGVAHRVDIAEVVPGWYSLIVDGHSHDLGATPPPDDPVRGPGARGGATRHRRAFTLDGEVFVADVGHGAGRGASSAGEPGEASAAGEVRAPMPGLVVAIQVAEGAEVTGGRPLIIMEAMKMQMEIRAPRTGTVRRVHAAAGQEVAGGQLLVTIE